MNEYNILGGKFSTNEIIKVIVNSGYVIKTNHFPHAFHIENEQRKFTININVGKSTIQVFCSNSTVVKGIRTVKKLKEVLIHYYLHY